VTVGHDGGRIVGATNTRLVIFPPIGSWRRQAPAPAYGELLGPCRASDPPAVPAFKVRGAAGLVSAKPSNLRLPQEIRCRALELIGKLYAVEAQVTDLAGEARRVVDTVTACSAVLCGRLAEPTPVSAMSDNLALCEKGRLEFLP